MITKEQKEYLLPMAYNAACRAGAVILDIYNGSGDFMTTLKSDRTPITVADRRSHDLIKEYLGRTRIPQLSEEGREMLYAERKGWDLFWLVDPLDGTKEFIKGNGEFTVNIALVVDNKPYFGVVYVPYINKIYFCDPDRGAFRCNLTPDVECQKSYDQLFEQTEKLPLTAECNNPIRIAVSRSHNTVETFVHIKQIKERYPDAVVIEQGSSFKFCLIAEGSVDYYVRTSKTYEWDTAAGESVLRMAGGDTISLPDRVRFDYNKESLLNPHFVCHSCWFEK